MRSPICICDEYEFIPIVRQPADFAAGLEPRDRAKLEAACRNVAEDFADGLAHSARTELVRGSKVRGLFELKITWPGTPGPQLRLLCVRERRRILVARGVVKRTRKLPRGEIEAAERALQRHLEERDESDGKGAAG